MQEIEVVEDEGLIAANSLSEETRLELWNRGELCWKLWEQQWFIYEKIRGFNATIATIVVLCARQFGKSVLCALLALEDCKRNRNVLVLIIGPTIKQTSSIVASRIKLLCQDAPEGAVTPYKNGWIFDTGSELVLGGFNTRASSERGKTLYRIYIEETRESGGDEYQEFMREDLIPALTHSPDAKVFHFTTLPGIPDHPFITETIPEAQMHGSFFKFTIEDNKKISPEQKAKIIELCGGVDSISYRVEYMCEMVRDTRLILVPEFDEDRHVAEFDVPEFCFFWVGADTGGTRDFTCFLLCGYDFRNSTTLIIDECWYPPETGSDIWAADCKAMEEKHRLSLHQSIRAKVKISRHVDAPGQLLLDLAGQHNFPCALPEKEGLEESINFVRDFFRKNTIKLHRRCKFAIQTLRSGTFNKNRTDLARTKVLGHMDAIMALCYALRYINRNNPYPLYNGATEATHYIPAQQQNEKLRALGNLFRPI